MIDGQDPQDLEEARRIIQALRARLEELTNPNLPKYPVRTLTEARACYLKDKLFSTEVGFMWSSDCRHFLTLEINDAFGLPSDCADEDIIRVMQKTADKFPYDVRAWKHKHPNGKRKFWIIERILKDR